MSQTKTQAAFLPGRTIQAEYKEKQYVGKIVEVAKSKAGSEYIRIELTDGSFRCLTIADIINWVVG